MEMFVKLTQIDGIPVFVNARHIDLMVPDNECTLLIINSQPGPLTVMETPDAIQAMIEHMGVIQ